MDKTAATKWQHLINTLSPVHFKQKSSIYRVNTETQILSNTRQIIGKLDVREKNPNDELQDSVSLKIFKLFSVLFARLELVESKHSNVQPVGSKNHVSSACQSWNINSKTKDYYSTSNRNFHLFSIPNHRNYFGGMCRTAIAFILGSTGNKNKAKPIQVKVTTKYWPRIVTLLKLGFAPAGSAASPIFILENFSYKLGRVSDTGYCTIVLIQFTIVYIFNNVSKNQVNMK